MHNLIAVVNESTELGDVSVRAMTDAVRKQAWYHAAPLWNLQRVAVSFYPDPNDAPPGSWVVGIFDHADQAGALGYHDRTPSGLAYGRVFIHPTWDEGVEVSSVLSHEVLEALGDPVANTWCDDDTGRSYARELCDPCQDTTYTDAKGIVVSDFVLPAWFTPGAPGPYTYRESQGHAVAVDGPFVIAPGGYAIVRTAGKVSYLKGARYPEWRAASLGEPRSRTAMRPDLVPA